MIELICAISDEDISAARRLFREYAESLDFDLDFQDFERELTGMPGAYGPPSGRLRLALLDGKAVGCMAIRSLEGDICEMKRLYVQPAHRRRGIGRMLAKAGVRDARELGYRSVRLDTVPSMAAATELYRSLGFVEIEPYRYNPLSGAIYMELELLDQD
jgi:putative acetyltransferase